MFSFLRKNKSETRFGESLKVDMHSHLIPGIDDGAPDMETSIQLIRNIQSLGYQKIITTPHTMFGLYSNTSEIIRSGLKNLQAELLKQKIQIPVEAASEYLLDFHFEKLIKNDDILYFGEKKYVLVEMSFVAPSMNYESMIFELVTKGYTPILAHPERYSYWHRSPEHFDYFTDAGCQLQVNLLSIAGYYGRDVKKSALALFEKRKVDFLGTDLHNKRHFAALDELQRSGKEILEIMTKYPFKNESLL